MSETSGYPRDGDDWLTPKEIRYARWLVENGRATGEPCEEPNPGEHSGSPYGGWSTPPEPKIEFDSWSVKAGRLRLIRAVSAKIEIGGQWFRVPFPHWDWNPPEPVLIEEGARPKPPELKPVRIHGLAIQPRFKWSDDFRRYMRAEIGKLFAPMPRNTIYTGSLFA